MTGNSSNNDINAVILRDFELEKPEKELSEEALLAYLADAIAYMIEHKLDYLLSLLYRLDISERKINAALLPGNPEEAHVALAKLVLERQKMRIATKQAYREKHPTNWNWDID